MNVSDFIKEYADDVSQSAHMLLPIDGVRKYEALLRSAKCYRKLANDVANNERLDEALEVMRSVARGLECIVKGRSEVEGWILYSTPEEKERTRIFKEKLEKAKTIITDLELEIEIISQPTT